MTSKRFHIFNVQMYPTRRNTFCDVIMQTVYNTLLIDQTCQMIIFRSLTEVFSLETNLMSLLTDV